MIGEKVRDCTSTHDALIDLVAIAPFYLGGLIGFDVDVLVALRLLRLARGFKLSRYRVPACRQTRLRVT
jgi:hypothetical protein